MNIDEFRSIWFIFFNQAFNRKEALNLGKIVPKPGVDEDFDSVQVPGVAWRVDALFFRALS